MSRFRKQLIEAYGNCSNAYLTNIRDVITEDKMKLHKSHDYLVKNTPANYSCPSLRAKIGNKTIRLNAIKEVLDSRLPEYYKE
jgi:hypothetical protein